MTLGDELRAVLSQEADMQYATPPDVDRLIIGGRQRRRHRNLVRAGGTALALVLVGGGAYAVAHQDGGSAQGSRLAGSPSATSDPAGDQDAAVELPPNGYWGGLDPGTYRVLVGGDAAGLPLEADLTLEAGWNAGNFPTTREDGTYAGFGVYRPWSLGAGSGCESDAPNADLGESPQALARALANLPRSTVIQPIEPTRAWGHYGQHLRLRIQEHCGFDEVYRVAETPRGTRGINYGSESTGVVIDFWVLDVDGATVVVDAWHQGGSSVGLVDKVTRAAESITFVSP
jgi:hypothetical protein